VLGRYKAEVARVAEPVARAMVGLRLRPNQLSCFGLVCSMIAAAAFAADQRRAGALSLALAGALDSYSDLLVLAGIVFLFARLGRLEAVAAVLLALIGTVMVSYTRARAESVAVECRVGLMERGERMLVLIVGALLDLLVPAIWVVAIGANVTAVHRIAHTWRATRGVLR